MSTGPVHGGGLNVTALLDKVVNLPQSERTIHESMTSEAFNVKESLEFLSKGPKPALPAHGLSGHAGFAIIHTVKASIVAGYERGTGIAIKVLGKDASGNTQLSAPVFVKTSKLSIGAALGVNKIYSAILIDREQDFALFTSTETTIGTDMALHNVALNKDEGPNAHESTIAVGGLEPKIISVEDASASLIDFSFAGGVIGPDATLNSKVYAGVSATDVLAGGVPVPEEFAELYAILKTNFVNEAGLLAKLEQVVAKGVKAVDAAMETDQPAV